MSFSWGHRHFIVWLTPTPHAGICSQDICALAFADVSGGLLWDDLRITVSHTLTPALRILVQEDGELEVPDMTNARPTWSTQ